MPMPAGTRPSPSYVLKDELAQFCLPKADKDPSRKVAWTNTFCLCVLAVGLMGIQKPVGLLLKLKSEEPPVVVIEDTKPVQQEFVRREEAQEEEPQDVQPDQPLLPTLVVILKSLRGLVRRNPPRRCSDRPRPYHGAVS